MKAYFDASVFATLILRDEEWESVDDWLSKAQPLPTLSDFGWGEFNASVGIRVRTRRFDHAQAYTAIAKAGELLQSWSRVDLQSGDVADATLLVAQFDLGLKLPDAIHSVLARRLEQILVTTDRQQAKAAIAMGLTVFNPIEGTDNQ